MTPADRKHLSSAIVARAMDERTTTLALVRAAHALGIDPPDPWGIRRASEDAGKPWAEMRLGNLTEDDIEAIAKAFADNRGIIETRPVQYTTHDEGDRE